MTMLQEAPVRCYTTAPAHPSKPADTPGGQFEIVETADRGRNSGRHRAVQADCQGPGEPFSVTREVLMELNPNLIVTPVSAYGPKGPWAKRKGWEVEAMLTRTAMEILSLPHEAEDAVSFERDRPGEWAALVAAMAPPIRRTIHPLSTGIARGGAL